MLTSMQNMGYFVQISCSYKRERRQGSSDLILNKTIDKQNNMKYTAFCQINIIREVRSGYRNTSNFNYIMRGIENTSTIVHPEYLQEK